MESPRVLRARSHLDGTADIWTFAHGAKWPCTIAVRLLSVTDISPREGGVCSRLAGVFPPGSVMVFVLAWTGLGKACSRRCASASAFVFSDFCSVMTSPLGRRFTSAGGSSFPHPAMQRAAIPTSANRTAVRRNVAAMVFVWLLLILRFLSLGFGKCINHHRRFFCSRSSASLMAFGVKKLGTLISGGGTYLALTYLLT